MSSDPLEFGGIGVLNFSPTRAIPEVVKPGLAARRVESYYAAQITLPQQAGDAAPVVLHVATALVNFAVPNEGGVGEVDPGEAQAFDPRIKPDSVQVKHSTGRSPDGGELTLQNADRVYGQTIAQVGRRLAGARVRVFKVWRVHGVDVPDEVFTGYLRAPRVNGDEVKFPLVSDMSRKGEVVGGTLLTMRCKWPFKDGVHCTYAGAETFCSHVLDDAEAGCKKYGHEFEFEGIPTQGGVAQVVSGGTAGGGGGGGSTGFGDPGELYPHPRSPRADRDFHPELQPIQVY